MYDVKIVEDTINVVAGTRLTTFECTYPRIIHEEVLTHAAISLVTASSRAVPTKVWVSALREDPFIPGYWGAKESGMTASQEIDPQTQEWAEERWRMWIDQSIETMKDLDTFGVHKQITNRPPHAGTWITSVLSATEWMNFFGLRFSEFAQPEFQCLAAIMWDEYNHNRPVHRNPGEWHLPYITDTERTALLGISHSDPRWWSLALRSTARCGRTSYFRSGVAYDEENEVKRATDFINQGHWSTAEFAALVLPTADRVGNLIGFKQLRKFYVNEAIANFSAPEKLPGRYEEIRWNHFRKKHPM